MSEPTVVHSTLTIERHYGCSPARLFAAFSDAGFKKRWYADGHLEVLEYSLDFRQGGVETTRSKFPEGTPFPGAVLQNDVVIQEIQPGRRIVQTGAMSLEGRRFSVSLVTFEFLEEEGGTTLVCTDQISFLEGADGPEMREAGWRELFGKLAAVLE